MARSPSTLMAASRRFSWLLSLALVLSGPAWGRMRVFGWCQQGGHTVQVGGQISVTKVQQSFPSCSVYVTINGGGGPATLYSNDSGTGLANPFTASTTGYWFFYVDGGRYDITLSGGGILTPFTLSDVATGGLLSLNGLTSATQTFTNDTNVTITSGGSTHTLGWAGNLAVSRGGSGAGTFTVNGVLLGNGTSGFQATGAGSTGQVLRVPGGGPPASFGPVDLSLAAAVTGALGIVNGGTSASTASGAFDALSPLSTKGDVLAHTGATNTRLGVGANALALLADSTQATGLRWGQVSLTAGVTGVTPIANGGTSQATKTLAMNALSPATTKGDLLTRDGTNTTRLGVGTDGQILIASSAASTGLVWGVPRIATSVKGDMIVDNGTTDARLPVGANGQVVTADSTQTLGVKWATPTFGCAKYTVLFSNAAFIANSPSADVTLFTVSQYQKLVGVTVKHSVVFDDAGGPITDVSVSLGYSGAATFYTLPTSIGAATGVVDTAIQDTSGFKSHTMAGAGEALLAHFISTGANLGTGAVTNLTTGSVDFWVCSATVQ